MGSTIEHDTFVAMTGRRFGCRAMLPRTIRLVGGKQLAHQKSQDGVPNERRKRIGAQNIDSRKGTFHTTLRDSRQVYPPLCFYARVESGGSDSYCSRYESLFDLVLNCV